MFFFASVYFTFIPQLFLFISILHFYPIPSTYIILRCLPILLPPFSNSFLRCILHFTIFSTYDCFFPLPISTSLLLSLPTLFSCLYDLCFSLSVFFCHVLLLPCSISTCSPPTVSVPFHPLPSSHILEVRVSLSLSHSIYPRECMCVYMCMGVCTYCLYICVWLMGICTYVYGCLYFLFVYMCMGICTYLCIYVYGCLYVCLYICVRVFVRMCVYMCMGVYTYVCMYVYERQCFPTVQKVKNPIRIKHKKARLGGGTRPEREREKRAN